MNCVLLECAGDAAFVCCRRLCLQRQWQTAPVAANLPQHSCSSLIAVAVAFTLCLPLCKQETLCQGLVSSIAAPLEPVGKQGQVIYGTVREATQAESEHFHEENRPLPCCRTAMSFGCIALLSCLLGSGDSQMILLVWSRRLTGCICCEARTQRIYVCMRALQVEIAQAKLIVPTGKRYAKMWEPGFWQEWIPLLPKTRFPHLCIPLSSWHNQFCLLTAWQEIQHVNRHLLCHSDPLQSA